MHPAVITILSGKRQFFSTGVSAREERKSVCFRKPFSGLLLHDISYVSWGPQSKEKRVMTPFHFLASFFFPLPTVMCYTIISLLESINYDESCLRMCCFTRKHSWAAITFWLNCWPHLSELKAHMSDKPYICKPVPSGVKKYALFLWRVLEQFTGK